jgi:hypothetical protein
MAAALEWSRKDAEGAIDFQKFCLTLWLLDRHIKGVIRCQAASTQKVKLFFGSGNLLVSIEILEIRFGNTTEAFLEPSTASLLNLQLVTCLELLVQEFVSSFHSFAHDDDVCSLHE